MLYGGFIFGAVSYYEMSVNNHLRSKLSLLREDNDEIRHCLDQYRKCIKYYEKGNAGNCPFIATEPYLTINTQERQRFV